MRAQLIYVAVIACLLASYLPGNGDSWYDGR